MRCTHIPVVSEVSLEVVFTCIGEGNCYYRAAMYAYVEMLICKGPQYLELFISLYFNCDYIHSIDENRGLFECRADSRVVRENLVPGLTFIHECIGAKGTEAALQSLFCLLNNSSNFDRVWAIDTWNRA